MHKVFRHAKFMNIKDMLNYKKKYLGVMNFRRQLTCTEGQLAQHQAEDRTSICSDRSKHSLTQLMPRWPVLWLWQGS